MRKYSEIIKYIFNSFPVYHQIGQAAYKADLYNAKQMDAYFSFPHQSFKTIHVGGTNGKGSVSHMLASVMQENGYRTGLFTSPHLIDYTERIKVNGKAIKKSFIVDFFEKHQPFFDKLKPSFFEMTVFLAFEYFKHCKVDIAIIEVGLGGRLDTTNVITPLLSIITNISFDHTQILGNDLKQIANEKAGIIKPHVPVVIGEFDEDYCQVFIDRAKAMDTTLVFADKFIDIDLKDMNSNSGFNLFAVKYSKKDKFENIKSDLTGIYQNKNLATVLTAVEMLKAHIQINSIATKRALVNVVKNTAFWGRWHTLFKKPRVILDTAHNEAGVKAILKQPELKQYASVHIICGFVEDKNWQKIVDLFPLNANYYFTKPPVQRALNPTFLLQYATSRGLVGCKYNYPLQALRFALANTKKNDLVLIFGSNFLVGEVLKKLKIKNKA
jgi:dihydrofolate synthase / folylpolyglutamate synthase